MYNCINKLPLYGMQQRKKRDGIRKGRNCTMRRRTSIALLTLLVLLCALPALALGLEPIQITSVVKNRDGSVTMQWDNPNDGNVTLAYLPLVQQETGNGLVIENIVQGSSYTFRHLAPGYSYILAAIPGVEVDYAGLTDVSIPEPSRFDSFRFSVTDTNLTYFVPKGNTYSYNYANDFSNDKIYELMEEKEFWVRLNISLTARSSSITLPALTVVIAPNGYVVAQCIDLELKERWESFWCTMLYLNNAFEELHDYCGEIPAGKYRVRLYLDGKFVDETSFRISQ